MLIVAVLFIVAYAAQFAGILEFLAARIMGDGRGVRRSVPRLIAPVVGISAFLNNTPIVAMFTPAIRDWAVRHHLSPSKFLIPLSYASIFGGICTLIGTSTNLVLNGLFQQATGRSLSMFELAWVGLPCAIVGTGYLLTGGLRLLPDRRDPAASLEDSGREYLFEMKVPEGSPLVGRTVEAAGLRHLGRVFLVEILRAGESLPPVKPGDVLETGDRLIFTGTADAALQLQKIPGLSPGHGTSFYQEIRASGRGRILEAVVSRSSPMLGKSIRDGNFRGRYDGVVLAVHRHGERVASALGDLVLRPGDTLLLLAGPDFLKRWNRSREFYMVSKVSELPQVNRRKTALAVGALAGMVILSATGFMEIFPAAVLAAMFLLLTRCLTPVEARRSLEINVLVVIACAFGISRALDKTGAAALLAQGVLGAVGAGGPVTLLAAIYVLTALLTAVITNNAAAALAFPIALATASQAGLDPKPFVVAIAVAASASFSTPIGYATNMMVYGPGGYRFADFFRVGAPLVLIFLGVSVLVIPRVWSF
jgi:di/tricarboxylate transporter